MDDADRAEERIEQAMDDALGEVRRSLESGSGLQPTGLCHDCAAPVGPFRLFCGIECSQSWEHERALKRMAGVK